MDELLNINEDHTLQETSVSNNELTTPSLRSSHTYTVVLEFFVKTIRVSMSLN